MAVTPVLPPVHLVNVTKSPANTVDNRIALAINDDAVFIGTKSVADKALSMVKSSNIDGEVAGLLTQVVTIANQLDVSSLDRRPNIISRLFKMHKNVVVAFKEHFDTIDDQIAEVEKALQLWRVKITERVGDLEALRDENSQSYNDLSQAIEQCQAIAHEISTNEIPQLEELMLTNNSPEIAQHVGNAKHQLNRLEKHIHDLVIMRHCCLNTEASIMLLKDNAATINSNIATTLNMTIPEWRKQFMLAVIIREQQQAQAMSTSVTDINNQIMAKNAAMLGQGMLEATAQSQRAVVDAETLMSVHKSLIGAVSGVKQQLLAAKDARTAYSAKIAEMEQEMMEVMSNHSKSVH